MDKLIFIMGVSGAGKSTVLEKLLTHTNLITVNTTTTRPIRPGEANGVTYDFVDDQRFDSLIKENDFLEYARVHQIYRYGTRKSLVQQAMNHGSTIIKNLEIYGWQQIVQQPDLRTYCYSIFMDIPDSEMIRRIKERNPDTSKEEIDRRIHSAQYERVHARTLCDHYIDVFGMTREEQYDKTLQLIQSI